MILTSSGATLPPIKYPTDIPIRVTEMIIAQITVVEPNKDATNRGPMISVARLANPEKKTRLLTNILNLTGYCLNASNS